MDNERQGRLSIFAQGTLPEWVGVIVVGVALVWGAFQFKSNLETEVISLRAFITTETTSIKAQQNAILQKLDSENRIAKLERTAALGEIKIELKSIDTILDQHSVNFNQVWPRLRAVDTNTRKLEDKIESLHKDEDVEIHLVEPQEF